MIWKKPKSTDTGVCTWKTWESKDGGYRVVHKSSDGKFYPMVKRIWDGPRWDSLKLGADGGTPLGVKSLEEAQAICEEHDS